METEVPLMETLIDEDTTEYYDKHFFLNLSLKSFPFPLCRNHLFHEKHRIVHSTAQIEQNEPAAPRTANGDEKRKFTRN